MGIGDRIKAMFVPNDVGMSALRDQHRMEMQDHKNNGNPELVVPFEEWKKKKGAPKDPVSVIKEGLGYPPA